MPLRDRSFCSSSVSPRAAAWLVDCITCGLAGRRARGGQYRQALSTSRWVARLGEQAAGGDAHPAHPALRFCQRVVRLNGPSPGVCVCGGGGVCGVCVGGGVGWGGGHPGAPLHTAGFGLSPASSYSSPGGPAPAWPSPGGPAAAHLVPQEVGHAHAGRGKGQHHALAAPGGVHDAPPGLGGGVQVRHGGRCCWVLPGNAARERCSAALPRSATRRGLGACPTAFGCWRRPQVPVLVMAGVSCRNVASQIVSAKKCPARQARQPEMFSREAAADGHHRQ